MEWAVLTPGDALKAAPGRLGAILALSHCRSGERIGTGAGRERDRGSIEWWVGASAFPLPQSLDFVLEQLHHAMLRDVHAGDRHAKPAVASAPERISMEVRRKASQALALPAARQVSSPVPPALARRPAPSAAQCPRARPRSRQLSRSSPARGWLWAGARSRSRRFS
jgi:hypothetical protein